jgi:hypothetical protein
VSTLPKLLRDIRWFDFSSFDHTKRRIKKNKLWVSQIRDIADYIETLHKDCFRYATAMQAACASVQL